VTEPTNDSESLRTRTNDISLRALRYMTQRPGQVVFVDEIAEGTGFTQKQIVSALGYLRAKNDVMRVEIKVIVAGKSWQYLPTMQPQVATPEREQPHVSAPPPSTEPAASTTPAKPRQRAARAVTNGNAELFEEVGRMADDGIIIKDSRGVMYVARKLTTQV